MKHSEKMTYSKPMLKKIDNIKNITFDCVDFNCSIVVPPEPTA